MAVLGKSVAHHWHFWNYVSDSVSFWLVFYSPNAVACGNYIVWRLRRSAFYGAADTVRHNRV